MNWPKLHQDYPLAYAKMVKEFKCLYTKSYSDLHENGVTYHEEGSEPTDVRVFKIKHPLKRDLHDFFDGVGLYVGVEHVGFECEKPFGWDIISDNNIEQTLPQVGDRTRSQTETEAFTKAFEILNKRLEAECSK
jgi:hypothetical protein